MKRTVASLVLTIALAPAFAGTVEDGMAFEKAGQFDQAAKAYESAARQGEPRGQFLLARLYETGQGLPQNNKQAVFWYTKAAEQGNAAVQNMLGQIYLEGTITPQDYKQAMYWLTQAAGKGNPEAQGALGEMYQAGKGVPKDLKQAYSWNSKAAEQGVPRAQLRVAMANLMGDGVAQNKIEAYKWLTLMSLAEANNDAESAILRQVQGIMKKMETDRDMPPANIAKARNLAAEWLKTHAN